MQTYKISESKTLSFSVTVPNAFNQHATTAYWENIDTNFYPQFLAPTSAACAAQNAAAGSTSSACTQAGNGYQFYTAAETGYNYKALFNSAGGVTGKSGAMTINSLYGQPLYHQLSRNLYMSVKFTF